MTAKDGMEITPRLDDVKALIKSLSVAVGEHLKTLQEANLMEMGLLIFPAAKIPGAHPGLVWPARAKSTFSHPP